MRSCLIKWFKHDSNAHTDDKVQKILMKYGAEGYALYWYCLELIAARVAPDNITFELKHDAEVLGYLLKIDTLKVEAIMIEMVNLGLFECVDNKITCMKLADRLDNATSQNPQIKKTLSNLDWSKPPKPLEKKLPAKKVDAKYTPADYTLAGAICSRIQGIAPKTLPNLDQWADDIRLMREQDKHTHQEIYDVFCWANDDDFWQTNILSIKKLRKQFAVLHAKMKQGPKNGKYQNTADKAAQRFADTSNPETATDF